MEEEIIQKRRKVGFRLAEQRKALGLKQVKIEKKLQMGHAKLSQIETGKFGQKVEDIYRLSKILRKPFFYFLEPFNETT